MKTNSRFVLLDMKDSSYCVYEGRKMLACYVQERSDSPEYQTAAEIENLRTAEFKDLA